METLQERMNNPFTMLQRVRETMNTDIRVAMPGIIVTFDPVEQVATVQPAIREKVRDRDGNVADVALPILPDVPVVFPRAGGFVLTVPVTAGDDCLVIFSDMCIDAWWQSGGVQNQMDNRRHDLSDAFALVGVTSQHNPVPNYSSAAMQLRAEDGSACIEVGASSIKVLPQGRGITFTSPDGTKTRTLSINDAGAAVWS